MSRRKLFWQVYPVYLLIILLSLVAVTAYASRTLTRFYLDETAGALESRARLIAERIASLPAAGAPGEMDRLCDALGREAEVRITVVAADGTVLGDSERDPLGMDSHKERPEIQEALKGRRGVSTRTSFTLQQPMMYVAVPLRNGDGPVACVVRTAIPVTALDSALQAIYLDMAVGGAVIALFAALIGLAVSRKISRPLERLKEGAERFANGDLVHRMEVPRSLEFARLAEAMNQMAARLDERIRTVIKQRNEQEAVLSSMVEGVLAVDLEERIINMNDAAARMMGVDATKVKGLTIQEVIRNTTLQQFVSRVLKSQAPLEGDLALGVRRDRFVQAHGTALRGEDNTGIGVLIVLNDVTRLRKLEDMRREFVANVSHELKTPITSVKGFVETLLEGALGRPEEARRFLDIISRQTNRLNAIINDLLSLSRIEQEAERQEILLEEGPLKAVLQSAAAVCEGKAAKKGISIDLQCPDTLRARINKHLLEQAIVNLLDNAITYSGTESPVSVEAGSGEKGIEIRVRDRGCGIGAEHLPRLFERFYRVDKARSRDQGGTGLGLAIVKHIVQAHGGRISVQSRPGEGSLFTVHLPAP